MNKDLHRFIERLMGVSPQYIDVFGRGLPGMAGSSAATSGAANSAADITVKLQHAATEFVRLYERRADQADLMRQAKELEGLLLAEQTLGTLDQHQSERLIDELYALIEAKEKE